MEVGAGSVLENIRRKNPNLVIHELSDPAFKLYGRQLTRKDFDFTSIIAKIDKMDIPESGEVYFPDCKEVGNAEEVEAVSLSLYGGMQVQIGYGAGVSEGISLLEFHQGDEILIWMQSVVMFLGHVKDIIDGEYDYSKMEAFYAPSGSVTDLYGGTLHGLPFLFGKYYRLGCILPYSTNFPLEKEVAKQGINRMFYAKNSWRIFPKNSKDDSVYKGVSGSIKIEI